MSINGVTFISGRDGPPPAVENAIKICSSLARACPEKIRHFAVLESSSRGFEFRSEFRTPRIGAELEQNRKETERSAA
jgi:hypothetical protein